MLRKIRRASRQLTVNRRQSQADALSHERARANDRAGFLDLPAELRNQVYEEVASSLALALPPAKPRKSPPPLNVLLLCKQVRDELEPVLLSLAVFVVKVSNYDFSNLTRVLRSLNTRQLAALRCNDRLWVLLLTAHVPTREHRSSLRSWLSHCDAAAASEPSGRQPRILQWQYDIAWKNPIRPPKPPSRYANGYALKADLLKAHLRMLQHVIIEGEGAEEGTAIKEGIEMYVNVLEQVQVQHRLPEQGEAREEEGEE